MPRIKTNKNQTLNNNINIVELLYLQFAKQYKKQL